MIEAGFPITSPGDFDSVQAIAREVHGPVICGLARTSKQDIDAAWNAIKDSERPRIHTFIATSDIHIERKLQTTREDVKGQARAAVAQARQYTDDVEFSPEDGSRSDVEFMAEVIQIALDEGATTINVPDTVGLHDAPRVRGDVRPPLRAGAGPARRDRIRALPRRPRAGRGQLVRRPDGGRPPGRVRHERDRRARGQRLARGDRDAAPHPRVERRALDRRGRRARSRAPRGSCRG